MIENYRARRLAAALLFIAAAPTAAAAQQDLPPASELVARYIKAIGGRDAVISSPDRRTVVTFSMPAIGVQAPMTVLAAKHPTRLMTILTIPGLGEVRNGYTGEVGWSTNPAVGPRLLEGEELASMVEEASDAGTLRDTSMFTIRETVGKTEMNGEPCYKVRLVWKSGRETFDCYSAKSGLLVANMAQEETPMGPVDVVTLLGDYKRFGKVLMPARVTQQMAGQEQVMTVDSVAYGPIDDAEFTPPQEIRALIQQKTSGGR